MVGPVLHLFDGPYVVISGHRHEIPEGSKRLVAFVALGGGWVDRRVAAGTLWPIGSDVRAAGNLRSALWRLRTAGIAVISADKTALRLVPGMAVDSHDVSERAGRLTRGCPRTDDLDMGAWRVCSLELLPGCHEDWVLFERERLRQRVLHALEALSRHLRNMQRRAEAIEAALTAVGVDPLRESAQRVLIEAHLADQNVSEARRVYRTYHDLIGRELGVRPSADLTALVGAAGLVQISGIG